MSLFNIIVKKYNLFKWWNLGFCLYFGKVNEPVFVEIKLLKGQKNIQ